MTHASVYLTSALGGALMAAALPAALPAAVPEAAVGVQAPLQTEVTRDPRTPFFRRSSDVSVGNKGEERLDVSVDAPCGRPAWLYDHAELVVTRNRFADVQFVTLPQPGCVACQPVTLRWFHEPTGYLSFEVNVYRRLEVVSCPTDNSPQGRG